MKPLVPLSCPMVLTTVAAGGRFAVRGSRSMNSVLRHLLGGLILLAVGAGVGCDRLVGGKDAAAKEKEPPSVPVEVAAIGTGPIQEIISSTARLEAEADVKVFARTANRVVEVLAEEGDKVAKDAVLLRLEDDIQTTRRAKAETALAKLRAEFERIEALYAQELVSEQVYSDTQFELRQLDLGLEDAERELEYTRVRAPIAGTVTQRLVKTGDLVNIGQHLFDLVDFDSLIARVYVPDRNLPALATNQVVRVRPTALGQQTYEGYVKRIAPTVDARTGTVKVTVGFRDIGPLRPGMYVEVELVTTVHADALLLSKRSLVYDQDLRFVYRLKEDRTVERVPVTVRLEDDFNVEPEGGFAAGDRIVVAGQTGLKDGAKVRLPGDPEPDAGAEGGPKPEGANVAEQASPDEGQG